MARELFPDASDRGIDVVARALQQWAIDNTNLVRPDWGRLEQLVEQSARL